MKRIAKFLWAFVILTASLTQSSQAEVLTSSCGDNIICSFDTETFVLTLSGTGSMTVSPIGEAIRTSVEAVEIGDGITSIPEYAFTGCMNLKSVILPNSIKRIGNYAFAFTALESVDLPDSLTNIARSLFMGCSRLTKVRIPQAVDEVRFQAFYYCNSLKEIVCEGEIPAETMMQTYGTSVFNMDKQSIRLVVPPNAVNVYTAAMDWKDFNIVTQESEEDFIPTDTRMLMTSFKNPGDPHSQTNRNTVSLEWYPNSRAYGYQVRWAYQANVSSGQEGWQEAERNDLLLGDTVLIGGINYQLTIKHLAYGEDYRFAIRVLHSANPDDSQNSLWYGYGNGREWGAYYGVTTAERYSVPYVVYANQAETTENTLTIHLNSNLSQVSTGDVTLDAENEKSYRENFNIDDDGDFGYRYLQVLPSDDNPDATVDEKWRYYEITDEDRERGYVVVTGLTPNSVYVIDVIDPTVLDPWDAKYNTCIVRTDGIPGDPILLKHDEMIALYANSPLTEGSSYNRADVYGTLAEAYDAAPITPVLYDFISNTNHAEGQTFWLEGGKTYYLDGSQSIYKGFVLRTTPEDLAQGKRARVICGLGKNSQYYTSSTNGEQWQGSYAMFMLGRQREAGEGGEIHMKKLAFYDIDFDNPTALNYGDYTAGKGVVAGNYFFNMYSNGMPVTLDSLVIKNCSFKRLVRGFIREQGVNYKVWNHVLIENNLFYDCGYYNQGAGGYYWIAGSGNCVKSNLYADFKCIENTFYDSPFPSFFSEEKSTSWEAGIVWNITFSNNTLINFNTRGNGSIFKMRNLPDGSVFNVENNLMVLCKKPDDLRVLNFYGADIRETWKPDGSSGKITLNFNNNWSTNNDLTNGQIFSGNAWTSTSNNFGKLVKNNQATLNGTLDVNVAGISATELMEQPCPPHVALTNTDQHMHRADALDGTATTDYNVNLFLQDTDKVRESEIYQLNVGASRWRSSVTDPTNVGGVETTPVLCGKVSIYNITGGIVRETVLEDEACLSSCLSGLPIGLYVIKSNDKVVKMIKCTEY